MTVKQEAYSLIDSMPEESVSILVQIMRLLPQEKSAQKRSQTESMEAFSRMEERRKRMRDIDISGAQRASALDEKYGSYFRIEGTT